MKYIVIKEWGQYQHYKDRAPAWIKLHRSLLTSPTWAGTDDATRVLAIALMVLASQNNNRVLADPDYIKRAAYLNRTPEWSKLVSLGFIEIVAETGVASMDQSDASVDQASKPNITQRREEKIEEKKREDGLFELFWEAFPNKVAKGKAREAFAKAETKVPGQQIVDACKAYLWPSDSQFIPHPSSWLNQERWLDKPAKPTVTHSTPSKDGKVPYVAPPSEEDSWSVRANVYAGMIAKGQRAGMQPPSTIERLVKEGYVTQEQCEAVGYHLWSKPDPEMRAKVASMMAGLKTATA